MAIEDDDIYNRCFTCSTECSCTINRHGFIFDFVVLFIHIGRMKYIELSCYYYNVFDLILISQNNDNGHPSSPLSQSTVQFILVTTPSYSEDLFDLIRFNTVSFICFHSFRSIDTIQFDPI
jgi:hypothetical protein